MEEDNRGFISYEVPYNPELMLNSIVSSGMTIGPAGIIRDEKKNHQGTYNDEEFTLEVLKKGSLLDCLAKELHLIRI